MKVKILSPFPDPGTGAMLPVNKEMEVKPAFDRYFRRRIRDGACERVVVQPKPAPTPKLPKTKKGND